MAEGTRRGTYSVSASLLSLAGQLAATAATAGVAVRGQDDEDWNEG